MAEEPIIIPVEVTVHEHGIEGTLAELAALRSEIEGLNGKEALVHLRAKVEEADKRYFDAVESGQHPEVIHKIGIKTDAQTQAAYDLIQAIENAIVGVDGDHVVRVFIHLLGEERLAEELDRLRVATGTPHVIDVGVRVNDAQLDAAMAKIEAVKAAYAAIDRLSISETLMQATQEFRERGFAEHAQKLEGLAANFDPESGYQLRPIDVKQALNVTGFEGWGPGQAYNEAWSQQYGLTTEHFRQLHNALTASSGIAPFAAPPPESVVNQIRRNPASRKAVYSVKSGEIINPWTGELSPISPEDVTPTMEKQYPKDWQKWADTETLRKFRETNRHSSRAEMLDFTESPFYGEPEETPKPTTEAGKNAIKELLESYARDTDINPEWFTPAESDAARVQEAMLVSKIAERQARAQTFTELTGEVGLNEKDKAKDWTVNKLGERERVDNPDFLAVTRREERSAGSIEPLGYEELAAYAQAATDAYRYMPDVTGGVPEAAAMAGDAHYAALVQAIREKNHGAIITHAEELKALRQDVAQQPLVGGEDVDAAYRHIESLQLEAGRRIAHYTGVKNFNLGGPTPLERPGSSIVVRQARYSANWTPQIPGSYDVSSGTPATRMTPSSTQVYSPEQMQEINKKRVEQRLPTTADDRVMVETNRYYAQGTNALRRPLIRAENNQDVKNFIRAKQAGLLPWTLNYAEGWHKHLPEGWENYRPSKPLMLSSMPDIDRNITGERIPVKPIPFIPEQLTLPFKPDQPILEYRTGPGEYNSTGTPQIGPGFPGTPSGTILAHAQLERKLEAIAPGTNIGPNEVIPASVPLSGEAGQQEQERQRRAAGAGTPPRPPKPPTRTGPSGGEEPDEIIPPERRPITDRPLTPEDLEDFNQPMPELPPSPREGRFSNIWRRITNYARNYESVQGRMDRQRGAVSQKFEIPEDFKQPYDQGMINDLWGAGNPYDRRRALNMSYENLIAMRSHAGTDRLANPIISREEFEKNATRRDNPTIAGGAAPPNYFGPNDRGGGIGGGGGEFGGSGLSKSIDSIGNSAVQTGSKFAVIGTAATAAFTTAGAAAATLPAILAGSSAGLGAIIGGFRNVGAAIEAYTQMQVTSAQTNAAVTQQVVSNAFSIEQAQNQVTVASKAASMAQAQAQYSVGVATQQVVDAQIQSFNSLRQATQQSTLAQQGMQDAEFQSLMAQRNLTQSYIDAKNQLINYNDQLKDGALNQKQNILSVQEAQFNLNKVLGDPSATALQREQALLTYQQAKQQYQDGKDQYAQLQQAAAIAAKRGVAGNTEVMNAQQGVIDSNNNLKNAMFNLTSAAINQWQQQYQAIVTNRAAQNNLAMTTLSNNNAVWNSQNSLNQSLIGLANAQQQAALSMAAMSNPIVAFNQAMSKLGPAGQQFVNWYNSTLRPILHGLVGDAQKGFLPGFQSAISAAMPLLSALGPVLTTAGKGAADFLGQIAKFAGSKQGVADFQGTMKNGFKFLDSLGGFINDLIIAFSNLGASAGPGITAIGGFLDKIGGMIVSWSGSNGPTQLFSNLAGILGTIGTSFNGTGLLAAGFALKFGPLAGLAFLFHKNLTPLIDPILKLAGSFLKIVQHDIGPIIGQVATSIGQLALALLPAMPSLGHLLSVFTQSFADAISSIASALAVMLPQFIGMLDAVMGHKGVADVIVGLGLSIYGINKVLAFSDAAKAGFAMLKGLFVLDSTGGIGGGGGGGKFGGKIAGLALGIGGLAILATNYANQNGKGAKGPTGYLTNVGSGAMAGAGIGMMFGPEGAGIGAGIGALVGLAASVPTQNWKNWGNNVWQLFDSNVVHPIVHFFANTVYNVVTGAFKSVGNWGNNLWQLFDSNVVHPVVHFFTNVVPDTVTKVFNGAGKWLFNSGKNLIVGLWNGVASWTSNLSGKIADLGGKIISWFGSALGLGSPSRITHQHGIWLSQGLANGIIAGAPHIQAAINEMIATTGLQKDKFNQGKFDSTLTIKPLSAINNNSQAPTNTTIVLELDGRQFASAIYPDMLKTMLQNKRAMVKLGLS